MSRFDSRFSGRFGPRRKGRFGSGAAAGGIDEEEAASYTANAVNFDGSNDYLTLATGLTGASDNKFILGSLWLRVGADATNMTVLSNDEVTQFKIQIEATSRLKVAADRADDTEILDFNTATNSLLITSGYQHFLFSADMADTGKRFLYVDDAAVAPTWNTYIDGDLDWTSGSWNVGSRPGAANKLNADVADLYLTNEYLDISVEANRRKFIDANGKPVDLGSDGSTPTGTAPLIFLSGATAAWHTNKGSGGGFTENGALTDASASPSD